MRLFVFNISGHLVTVLSEGYKEAGKYSVDFHSRSLPSGVYFYKLQTPGWSDTKKMLLIK
ncbi:MAG: T9SS type A sorting domain-containing protein [Candidatus Marinimicrobia bacterium]|nr:T9SS type A sorting domain-containing protein [Candidatus Neomarinimicrobiota bacterium]